MGINALADWIQQKEAEYLVNRIKSCTMISPISGESKCFIFTI